MQRYYISTIKRITVIERDVATLAELKDPLDFSATQEEGHLYIIRLKKGKKNATVYLAPAWPEFYKKLIQENESLRLISIPDNFSDELLTCAANTYKFLLEEEKSSAIPATVFMKLEETVNDHCHIQKLKNTPKTEGQYEEEEENDDKKSDDEESDDEFVPWPNQSNLYIGLKNTPIFIIAVPKEGHDLSLQAGDGAYVKTLACHIEKEKKVTLITAAKSPTDIFKPISESIQGVKKPIVHLIINTGPPYTGCRITPEEWKSYKEQHAISIVITVIEFAKHAEFESQHATPMQGLMLEYLEVADRIIFLDEEDRSCALKKSESSPFSAIQQAEVIPVPATAPICTLPLTKRGKDIISFGMIRKGKGLGSHVKKLAEKIRDSKEKHIKNKKILIVGSIPKENKEAVDNPFIAGIDDTFQLLLTDVYPDKKKEIGEKKLHELEKFYQEDLRHCSAALPIEFHVNVPEEKLTDLFNRCTYSFLPAFRGATLRNTSISTSITNEWVTYTHATRVTPACLKTGKYKDALVIIQETQEYRYAAAVLKDILQREKAPHLNEKTQQKAQLLIQEVISIEAVIKRHLMIYGRLACSMKYSLRPFNQSSLPDPLVVDKEVDSLPSSSCLPSTYTAGVTTASVVTGSICAAFLWYTGAKAAICVLGFMGGAGAIVILTLVLSCLASSSSYWCSLFHRSTLSPPERGEKNVVLSQAGLS